MANQFPLVTSPLGEAEWAYLVKPDTKFNELGEYKVNVIVGPEEGAAFKAQLEGILGAFVEDLKRQADTKATAGKKKEVKVSEFLPWTDLEDGRVVFKFKRKAKVINDKGETFEFTVNLMDGRGAVIPPDRAESVQIGNGSMIRCRAEAMTYHSAMQGAGLSLRLQDVQIKKLVAYQSNAFDAIDDDDVFTFVASSAPAAGSGSAFPAENPAAGYQV